jgi:hypothetical protein
MSIEMPNVVQESDRIRQVSVMVWGGISVDSCMNIFVVRDNLTAVGTSIQYCYSMCWLLHMVLALNLYSCTTIPGLI